MPDQTQNQDVSNQEEVQENYLEALFNGETLTESFKEKATLIFETAVNARVASIEKALIDSSYEVLSEEIESGINAGMEVGIQNLTEAVDQYLTYVGKEWLQENKLEVEAGFRTEIAENFIHGLKDLFENSFVEVPEEKTDLVDGLFEEKERIEKSLNEEIKKNLQLQAELTKQLCIEQFVNISNDLTDTQIEKLATLVEGINFDTIEQYAEKVKVLKESYFGAGSSTNISTQDPTVESDKSTTSPLMENYVNAISRQLRLTNHKK